MASRSIAARAAVSELANMELPTLKSISSDAEPMLALGSSPVRSGCS
jgi:hypothetical protein